MVKLKSITFASLFFISSLIFAQKSRFSTITFPFNSRAYLRELKFNISDTLSKNELRNLGLISENDIYYTFKDINFDTKEVHYSKRTFKYYPVFRNNDIFCYRKDQEGDSIMTYVYFKGNKLLIEGTKGEKLFIDGYIDKQLILYIYKYLHNKDAYVKDSISKGIKPIKGKPKTIVQYSKYRINMKSNQFELIYESLYFCKEDSRKYKYMTIEDDPFSRMINK